MQEHQKRWRAESLKGLYSKPEGMSDEEWDERARLAVEIEEQQRKCVELSEQEAALSPLRRRVVRAVFRFYGYWLKWSFKFKKGE
jgi:hypothetical protein